MDAPDVTVAVPVKDRRERMLRCLDAVLAQDHPSFEVLVLDNGSGDGTAEACRERAASAAVAVRVEVVPGTIGAVRNQARTFARGRHIAFTDSDCLPAPGWLRAATAALDADPGLGLVCGTTLPERIPQRAWYHTVAVERPSWRFEGCNVVFRAEAFRASGGFDEEVGDGFEDTIAGFDVLRRGWRWAFVKEAVVHHDVTYPGYWHHVRREQRQRHAARLVARYPESRRRLFFAGLFVNARGAAQLLAVVGLVAGLREPRARWLVAPYAAWLARFVYPWRVVQIAILDAAMHVAIVRGAVRYRRLLL